METIIIDVNFCQLRFGMNHFILLVCVCVWVVGAQLFLKGCSAWLRTTGVIHFIMLTCVENTKCLEQGDTGARCHATQMGNPLPSLCLLAKYSSV